MAKLLSVKIPMPDFPMRQKIANILSAYDDAIENNLRRIALLEEAAQNLYREWFVDFRFPGWEEVEFLDGLPVEWERKELHEVAHVVMGTSPKSEFFNENSEGLPFHQGVRGYGFRFLKHDVFCTKRIRVAEKGDILFSVRAPVGRINLADQEMIIGRGLSAMRSKSDCQSFLLYQLKAHFHQEDMIGSGSIFNSVTKKQLLEQMMISPKKEMVEKFEKNVSIHDCQIEVLSNEINTLKEARDILLPRLMNGTIEVGADKKN